MSFINKISRGKHACFRTKKMSQPLPLQTNDGLMKIHLPKYRKSALRGYFPGRGNCRGCGKEFKKHDSYWEPAYFQHCINECEGYKKLGQLLYANAYINLFFHIE